MVDNIFINNTYYKRQVHNLSFVINKLNLHDKYSLLILIISFGFEKALKTIFLYVIIYLNNSVAIIKLLKLMKK